MNEVSINNIANNFLNILFTSNIENIAILINIFVDVYMKVDNQVDIVSVP